MTKPMLVEVGVPALVMGLSFPLANATVQLVGPSTLYADRINLLDLRVGKILRFRGTKTQVSADLFNAMNSNVVLNTNNTYNPTGTWEIPTQIAAGRLLKLTAQFEF